MKAPFKNFGLIGAAVGALVAATSSHAFEPSSPAETMLVEWLEASKCTMTQKDFMGKMLAGPGIPPSDIMTARRAMTKAGAIKKGSGNSLTLTAGDACGGAEVAEPTYSSGSDKDKYIGQLIGIFEDNGCVLRERDAKKLAVDSGMTREQLDIAGEAIDDDGGFLDTEAGLQLVFGKCKTHVAGGGEPDEDKLKAQLVAIFENNGCLLDEPDATRLAVEAGMTKKQVNTAGEALGKAGSFDETDEGLRLTIGKCADGTAKVPEGDDKTRIMAMFEQNGCTLDEDQLPDVAQQFQITRKQFRAVTGPMIKDGGFVEDDDDLTLVVGDICGKKTEKPATSEPRAIVLKLFEDNNCNVTEDVFTDAVEALNLEPSAEDAIGDEIEAMMDAGVVVFDEETEIASLKTGEKCGSGDAVKETPKMPSGDKRALIVELFEKNSCKMTENEATRLFPTVGLSIENDDDIAIIEQLFEAGDMIEGDNDSAVLVTGEVCGTK